MALVTGARIGPYEVQALLGAGGMGEVYRATDSNLKRAVAIKVLPDAVAADAERLARFQREAEVLAALNHPNIASIYGFERSGTTTALAMELVEGPTLAEQIVRGPLPVDDAIAIARQIAEALEAAHEQGIVHRDLKPANIKVRPDGVVKVLDFGLAKAIEPAAAMSMSASMSPTITTPAMTQAGIILGTAAYMSPEQARGKPVDKRSDIWAFGCVVYEMLTGRRAFEAEDVSLTLAEVMKSDPDWKALPALRPPIRICLRRCLKKDPRQRLRDIGEARLAFEGVVDVEEADATASAAPIRSVWKWVLPSTAAAAIAAAALTLWLRPNPLPEVVRFEIHAPAGSKIPPGTPAISPDGRRLAYVVAGPDGMRRLHLREMGAIDSRPVPGTENAIHPFWSPDGRSLAFTTERVLKRVDVDGGPPRDLAAQVSGPWHGSWNQFGDVLFLFGGITRVSADGGAFKPQSVTVSGNAAALAAFPSFLSDGRRFLALVRDAEGKGAVYLASLDSPEGAMVLDDVLSATLAAPTPSGRTYLIYMRDDALVAHEFDESNGQVRGTPRVLVGGIGKVASPSMLPTVGVSSAGVLAFQTGGDLTAVKLTWFDRSGKHLGDVPLELSAGNPSLSPDGRRLAFDAYSRGDRDIYITDLGRNVTTRLTRGAGSQRGPVWSPDGNRVAFYRGGKIYLKNVDDLSDETVLVDAGGVPDAWSPDGRYLSYEASQRKHLVWPLAGGAAIPIGRRDSVSRDAFFSSNSRYLAYVSDESGRDEVYVESLPPGKERIKVSANGGSQPRWSRTSRELFFIGPKRSLMVVDVQTGQTLSMGIPRRLFPDSVTVESQGFDVSPDGQRFLIRQTADVIPDAPITVVLNWWADLARKAN